MSLTEKGVEVTGLGNIIGAARAAGESRGPGGARAAARRGAPRPVRGERAAPRDEGPRLLLSKLPPLARRWGSAAPRKVVWSQQKYCIKSMEI